MTSGRHWMWISALGLGACSSDWVEPDPTVRADRWVRCCGLGSSPWVQTRGTGNSLECLCPAGSTCNWEQTCWERDVWPPEGVDAARNEAGFADAGPMDDAALDALITDDAALDGSSADDAAIDPLAADGAP